MSEGREERRFSRAYKVGVLSRIAAGETVSALSVELGIPRKYLYQWRERFRLGGEAALRSRGRPTKADMAAMRPGPAEPGTRVGSQPPPGRRDELDLARARIAELERKIGRQELELDFFQQALRRVEEVSRASGKPGGTGSTRSSKR